MARNDVLGRFREFQQRVVARKHVGHVVHDGKRRLQAHVVVIVAGVGRQHHPAARGMHAHRLQALRMAADMQQFQAGRDFVVAMVEGHALVVDAAHHVDHVLHRIRVAQHVEAHIAAAGVMQLAFLQMQAGVGQLSDIARVVVVQVRHDDVPDVGGRNAQLLQGVDRATQELAAAGPGGGLVEAGVDEIDAAAVTDDPDEIIHRHGAVMRVRRRSDEILGPAARDRRIAQGIDFVVGQRHAIPLDARMCSSSGRRYSSSRRGFSVMGKWPSSGMTPKRAPGISAATLRESWGLAE